MSKYGKMHLRVLPENAPHPFWETSCCLEAEKLGALDQRPNTRSHAAHLPHLILRPTATTPGGNICNCANAKLPRKHKLHKERVQQQHCLEKTNRNKFKLLPCTGTRYPEFAPLPILPERMWVTLSWFLAVSCLPWVIATCQVI